MWKYGPEVTYNVTYIADIIPPKATQDEFMSSTSFKTKLKCRPATYDTLNCHMDNPTIRLNPFNSKKSFAPSRPVILDNLFVDIKFNEIGIQELIVPSTISPTIINIYKSIINQFHTGFDLAGRTEGTFQIWENFTTGNCFTAYELELEDTKTNIVRKLKGRHKLWSPDVRAVIIKSRDLKKCRELSPYILCNTDMFSDKSKIVSTLVSLKNIFSA